MSESAPRFDVVVSGASYTGLALAHSLAVTFPGELRIAVVDRVAEPPTRSDARAFALGAASRHLLEAIGVWPAIARDAQPVVEIEITDTPLDAGVRPVLLTYSNLLDNGEPASHIVPGSSLMRALFASVSHEPAITLLAPEEVVAVEAGSMLADVTLASGRRLSAPLVVAAEGRKSSLRDRAGIKLTAWDYSQTGIVTTVEHERPHEGRAIQHFLPAGPFAILPLVARAGTPPPTPRADAVADGDTAVHRSCITWSEERGVATRILALADDAFLEEVDRRFGGRLGRLSLSGPRQSWPLSLHLARSYVAPRLALLGDTAHGVHPIAGQGLNLGLRDVAALAEVIADALRLGQDIGSGTVLERYERWRRFDSTVSAGVFDGLNRLFSNDTSLVRGARGLGLSVVNELPALKRAFVSEAAGLAGDVPKLLLGQSI